MSRASLQITKDTLRSHLKLLLISIRITVDKDTTVFIQANEHRRRILIIRHVTTNHENFYHTVHMLQPLAHDIKTISKTTRIIYKRPGANMGCKQKAYGHKSNSQCQAVLSDIWCDHSLQATSTTEVQCAFQPPNVQCRVVNVQGTCIGTSYCIISRSEIFARYSRQLP